MKELMTFTEWKAEVAKALTLKNMTKKDLAEATGYKYNYIAGVCCGTVFSRPAVKKISDVLGIEPYRE
ncbi:MAG: helix-turn-helix transcriptional regulator [Oscillospiraceae bacterium]|nr:helix-turn-helix transcriptional regulator [Oscillospiraceae bacterium]